MKNKILCMILACSLVLTMGPGPALAANVTANGDDQNVQINEPVEIEQEQVEEEPEINVEDQVEPPKETEPQLDENKEADLAEKSQAKEDQEKKEHKAQVSTYSVENKTKSSGQKTAKQPAQKPLQTIPINTKNFNDKTFREYVKAFDENKDGKLDSVERRNVKKINLNSEPVTNLKGISYFNDLTVLNIAECTNLKKFDASYNKKLRELYCWEANNIETLKIDENVSLEKLDLSYTGVKKINLDKNVNLKSLNCAGCHMTGLNLGKNTKLEVLDCSDNQLGTLSLKNNKKLKDINCWNNPKLKSIDVTACTELTNLDCSECVNLEKLDIRKCTKLKKLECWSDYKIKTLNLSNNTALEYLDCGYNELTNLNLSKNLQLKTLICEHCALTALDISANTKLTDIQVEGNQLPVSIPIVLQDNLSTNFNPDKVSNVEGGIIETLNVDGKEKFLNFKFINSDTITYDYEIKKGLKAKFSIKTVFDVPEIKPNAVSSLAVIPDFGMIKASCPVNKQPTATYRFAIRINGTDKWQYFNRKSNEIVIKKLKKNVLYEIAVANVVGDKRSPYKQKRIYTNRLGNGKEPMASSLITKLSSGKKGAVTVSTNKVRYLTNPKTVNYKFAYRLNGTKEWKYVKTSQCTKTIEKLKSGKTYNFAVCHYYISPLDKKTEVTSSMSKYKNIKVK